MLASMHIQCLSSPPYIMVDEVKEVSWCDGHGASSSLGEPGVGLVQGLVHVHKGIDDGLAMGGGLRDIREHSGEQIWTHIL